MIDEDFNLLLIGDDERGTVALWLFVCARWSLPDESDDKDSSSEDFRTLLLVGINGAEYKSRISVDGSGWIGGDWVFIIGTSCGIINGFEIKRDDGKHRSSRSGSCSDNDGVEADEAIDDDRCFGSGGESIMKNEKKN